MYYAGTLAYLSAAALFAYFVSTSYLDAVSQAYIATDLSSGECQSVPISTTASYLADLNGNWAGSNDFDYSLALYDVSFNNFQVSSITEYQTMMNTFYAALNDISVVAEQQNLPFNLLLWISFIRYYSVDFPDTTNFTSIGFGNLQYLQLTGDAQTIYTMHNHIVTVGSAMGVCPVHALTEFDTANAAIRTNLDFTVYSNDSTCMKSLPPYQFGFNTLTDNNDFELSLNVESFILSMAVNMGFLRLDDLSRIFTVEYPMYLQNTTYLLGEYFDNRNLEMIPIWCLYNATAIPSGKPNMQSLCFYLYDTVVALPVFNHLGVSYNQPEYCDCATVGKSFECNAFNLLSGLVYFPLTISSSNILELLTNQIPELFEVLLLYDGDYSAFNNASYEASWTLAADIFGEQYPTYTTSSWYSNIFDFCKLSAVSTCSMLVFNSQNFLSQSVSDYKFQLINGSCANSVLISGNDW
jgi:hypothetical protein